MRCVQAEQLDFFAAEGFNEIDTARMYANGDTEDMLGRVLEGRDAISVTATKANPFNGESLSPEGVRAQLEASLAAMNKESAEIFYLHAPDPDVPIEDTLAEVQKMYEEGKFKQLGLSNYQSWEVVHIYHVCLAKGWVLPTIYQGMCACSRLPPPVCRLVFAGPSACDPHAARRQTTR